MATNANNAIAAKPKVAGGLWVAPLGTALPTTEVVALNAAFKAVGYVTEDGVTRTEERNAENLLAWGGDTILVAQTGVEAALETNLAEYLNPETAKLLYGTAQVATTAATGSAGAKMTVTGKLGTPAPQMSWVLEMFSGTATLRVVFPKVQVTEFEDVTFKDDELAARGVTATLFPDASGNYFYEYSDDGVFV
jgi:hypothetical protein